MAELADALALGASGRKAVQVQVLFSAPPTALACPIFPIALSNNAGVGCTYFCEITMLLCPASLRISKASTPLSPSRVQNVWRVLCTTQSVRQLHRVAQRPELLTRPMPCKHLTTLVRKHKLRFGLFFDPLQNTACSGRQRDVTLRVLALALLHVDPTQRCARL